MTHDLTESRPAALSSSSRRSVLRAGVWTVPAVTLVTAAPAVAATPPVGSWTVTSSSWEGTTAGVRNNTGTLQLRFHVDVPTGTTVSGATATFTFTGDVQLSTAVPIPAGWTTSQATGVNTQTITFVYTGDMTASNDLNFQLNNVASGDVGGTTNAVFSSSSETGPTVTFDILAVNDGAADGSSGYITTPHI